MGKWTTALAMALTLAMCGTAAARPVSSATARHTIQTDRFHNVDGREHVVSCSQERRGTLCLVRSAPVCFDDNQLGPATVVGTGYWWVSRTRGRVTDAPVGHERFDIYAAGDCTPGS